MTNKFWYRSRTLWLNFMALVVFILQFQFGFVIPMDVQAAVLAILNFFLRFATVQPISG